MTNRCLFLLCSLLAVQQTLAQTSPSQLEKVTVSAARIEITDQGYPGNITVISADEIERSASAHVADILHGLGGINISDLFGDGTDATIGIRGFDATAMHNTLIMIDGRRLNNVDNGIPDLNSVSIKNIERIEIIKGSAGALYGDKAVGGVINIITRTPEELSINAELGYGSYDRQFYFAGIENRHDNGLYYRLNASRRLTDNYRDENGLQLTDIYAKVGYDYASGNIFIEGQDLNEDIKTPGPLFLDQLQANRRQVLNPGDFINTDTQVARLGIQHSLNDRLDFLGELTWRESETEGVLSSSGFPSMFTSNREHLELTPRVIFTLPLSTGNALITLGSDLFSTDYELLSPFGLTDDTQDKTSVYFQSIIPLSDRISLTLGGRHSKIENDILVDTLAFGRSLPEGSEIDDSANAWEVGISYQINEQFRLFAKVDRNFRFVSADEYSAIADNNFFAGLFGGLVVPLPETQTGHSFEAGLGWSNGQSRLDLQAYLLDLENEIVFDPILFLNTNIGDTERLGFILEGNHFFNDYFQIGLNYSYIDSEITSGSFTGSELTFIPEHTVNINANYQVNEKLTSHLEIVSVSKRIFGGDFSNSYEPLSGYTIANMNVNYRFKNYSVSLKVNNLLDKKYSGSGNIGFEFRDFSFAQVPTYFPAPERNFMFTLRYER